MQSLIHADIFFFITTIALIVIAIGIIIVLIYVIDILRTLSQVSKKIKAESEEVIKDVQELRGSIKKEGFRLKTMAGFFGRMFDRRKSK